MVDVSAKDPYAPGVFGRTLRSSSILVAGLAALMATGTVSFLDGPPPVGAAPSVPRSTTTGTGRVAPKAAQVPTGSTLPAAPLRVKLTQIATARQPVALSTRPNDTTLFIVEKEGRIRALRKGVLDPTAVLDLSNRVSSENERGLLGLAFPPNGDPFAYLHYTDLAGSVVISEFAVAGDTFDASSERVLLKVPKPYNEHNAGTLSFDTAGSLYIAIGDGGGSGDKFNNAQNTNVLLGKVLRIIPRPGDLSTAKPYGIPANNPFATKNPLSSARRRPEVFAYGLRNPWRASVDAETGDVWIPDVGQGTAEEINYLPAGKSGANFGWRLREGRQPFSGGKPVGAIDPVYDYPHRDGRCAVAGGAVYRGQELVALRGWYVFGDVCSGQLAALHREGARWKPYALQATVGYLTGFGVDNEGEMYALSLEGAVLKLEQG